MAVALSSTHPSPMCTEQELVAAIRAGSDRAFEELYSRYRSRISSYIVGMVGDHARAEDIAQDVFISALRRLRRTDGSIQFKPWIYEIAKNACIDEFRRTRRAREVPLEDEDDEADHGQKWLASTATPDVAVDQKQLLEDLRGAFHSLSENHHKVIVMRELEGLSYGQIGERLGMTRPVVESTLFRARRRLSAEYNELVSGRRCQHIQALIEAGEPKSLLKLGVRERRQLARHLAHCQTCRRYARVAGVDDSLFQAPTVIGKLAALLPIPTWLRWRRGSGGDGEKATGSSTHSFALVQPFQTVSRYTEMVGASSGMGRAATAAAALAIAGLGGGIATMAASGSQPALPVHPAALVKTGAHTGAAAAATRAARNNRHGSSAALGKPRGVNGAVWLAAARSHPRGGPGAPSSGSQSRGGQTSSGGTSGSPQAGGSSSNGTTTTSAPKSILPVSGGAVSTVTRLLPKVGKLPLPSGSSPTSTTNLPAPKLPSVGGSGNGSPLPKVNIPSATKVVSGVLGGR